MAWVLEAHALSGYLSATRLTGWEHERSQTPGAMQQPQPPNPANPLPNLATLSLLHPQLQAAIDLYVRLTGPEVHGHSQPVESPMMIARQVCKMASFLSQISKSATPPDFYKVYAIGMGVPGANQWPDQDDSNQTQLRQRLLGWCRKIRTREDATHAAGLAIVNVTGSMEEALWCAKRGAYPLTTLSTLMRNCTAQHIVRHWWPLVEAFGGKEFLQYDSIVEATHEMTFEFFAEWMKDILSAAVATREMETANDSVVLGNLVMATFDVPFLWEAGAFHKAASNLGGGCVVQARFLMDAAVSYAQWRGRQDTPMGQHVAYLAAAALARDQERWRYQWNTPGPNVREAIDELIENYPIYLGNLLFGALMDCQVEHVRYFVERHFYHAGNLGCNLSNGQRTALLLHLFSGSRTGGEAEDEIGDPEEPWGEDPDDSDPDERFPGDHRKFAALVEAIERAPQRDGHWINQRIAAALLDNALITPHDKRGLELLLTLLVRTSPTTRFFDQTLRQSVGRLLSYGVTNPVKEELPHYVRLLRLLLRFCRTDLKAQFSFVDAADQAIADGASDAQEGDATDEYLSLIDAFTDAGVVFTSQNATRLAAMKGRLVGQVPFASSDAHRAHKIRVLERLRQLLPEPVSEA